MKPEQQLRVLRKIWGRNRRGYIFLPWIAAENAASTRRKQSWQEGRAYHWPRERNAILSHLYKHAEDDLYFSVQMFEGKVRRSEEALVTKCLYADLDEVDPQAIPERYQPTYVWQTSPGRYAAAWELNEYLKEATEPGDLNHRLTQFLGADPSGWDTTQVLRVPGSVNNKASVIKANKGPVRGTLIWENGEVYESDKFDELPEIDNAYVVNVDTISEELLESVDRHAVWAKVRLKVSGAVRGYMRMRDTEDLDRSDVLWQITCDLAEVGCSRAEIVAITRATVWNKYEGRPDELKRLLTEATKALKVKQVRTENGHEPLEPEEGGEKPKTEDLKPFWLDDSYLNIPEPEWLVEGFIPQGGCGFISGAPKSMKSWLALDLAISVSNGIPFLDYPTAHAANVLYIQQEDPTVLVRQRHVIIASSKAPQHVPGGTLTPQNAALIPLIQSGFIGTDMGWQSWLDEQIGLLNIELVIFDTLATIASGIDIDKASEVKRHLLDPIKVIARANNCAMLFVHHNTKSSASERSGQNMSGSGQIHAWADMGFYAREKTNDNKLTFDIETKYTGTHRLTYHLDGLDNDPKEWLPREVLQDEAAGSGVVVDLHTARAPKYATRTAEERAAAREARKGKGLSMHAQKQLEGEDNKAAVFTLCTRGKRKQTIMNETGLSAPTVTKYMAMYRDEQTRILSTPGTMTDTELNQLEDEIYD